MIDGSKGRADFGKQEVAGKETKILVGTQFQRECIDGQNRCFEKIFKIIKESDIEVDSDDELSNTVQIVDYSKIKDRNK